MKPPIIRIASSLAGIVLAVAVLHSPSAQADAARGEKLYKGTLAGSYGCNQCHIVTNSADLIRTAAGNPDQIDYAIYTALDSSVEMRPLFAIGAPYELSDQDKQDLADYIDTVVNPGGGGSTPTFTLTPSSNGFGSVVTGAQSSVATFTVKVTSAAGNVTSVSSSNSAEFLVAGGSCLPTPHALAVNATCTVQVVFQPTATGSRSSTLQVLTSGSPSSLTASLSGTGTTSGGGSGSANTLLVVEYYNATLNHYFITPNAVEISLLGKPPFQDWQPTGYSFNAYKPGSAPAGTVAVCRFYNDHFPGISTHFYAPKGLGCEDVLSGFPDWTLEDDRLFYAYLPNAQTGNCPTGQLPVYRMYNNGMGGAPNHRFSTDSFVRQQMLNNGYAPEGAGIGVGWCAPQ